MVELRYRSLGFRVRLPAGVVFVAWLARALSGSGLVSPARSLDEIRIPKEQRACKMRAAAPTLIPHYQTELKKATKITILLFLERLYCAQKCLYCAQNRP